MALLLLGTLQGARVPTRLLPNWTAYTEADGLAANWDTTIAAASDGAAWIATDGGVSRYVPPR